MTKKFAVKKYERLMGIDAPAKKEIGLVRKLFNKYWWVLYSAILILLVAVDVQAKPVDDFVVRAYCGPEVTVTEKFNDWVTFCHRDEGCKQFDSRGAYLDENANLVRAFYQYFGTNADGQDISNALMITTPATDDGSMEITLTLKIVVLGTGETFFEGTTSCPAEVVRATDVGS